MKRNRNRFSFTLIELLVVVAIIAILAGMLLPALNNARKRGKTLQCLSNLRQDGQFCAQYLNDCNEWYPSNLARSTRTLSWVAYLYSYMGSFGKDADEVSEYLFSKLNDTTNPDYEATVKKFISLACPQEEWLWRTHGGTSGIRHYAFASNFLVNSCVITDSDGANKLPAFKATQLRKSSSTFLLADGQNTSIRTHAFNAYTFRAGIKYVHNGRSNMLFADGHAGNVRMVTPLPPIASQKTTLSFGDPPTDITGEFLF